MSIIPDLSKKTTALTPNLQIQSYKDKGVYKVANSKIFYMILLIILLIIPLIFRLLTIPKFPEFRDSLYFLRGIQHYSVFDRSPHWPGYPVYIWLGSFFHLFISNPNQALHTLSVVFSTLTILPVSALARGFRRVAGGTEAEANLSGIAAAIIWAILPLSWINGSEIFSDPLALFLGLSIFWLTFRALQPNNRADRYRIFAAFLGGLMLGVRLSYVPLLLPLLYATWLTRKSNIKYKNSGIRLLPVLVLASLVLSVGLWLSWQWAMEGSRFIEAGKIHLAGHYGEWGGSVTTDKSIITRPLRFVETFLVYGLGGWWVDAPLLRIPATLGICWLLFMGIKRIAKTSRQNLLLVGMWIMPYSFWILLGNDVNLARYYFPMVGIVCIIMAVGLPSRLPISLISMVMIIALGLCITLPLALDHQTNPPLGQKLVNYLKSNLSPAQTTVIITEEDTVISTYLSDTAPEYQMEQIAYRDLIHVFWNLEAQGHTLYATMLPQTAQAGWVPTVRFCRGRYLESRGPLELWLYRHIKIGEKAPVYNPNEAPISIGCS